MTDFPRTIWMFWRQGWDAAPELVRRCLRSWEYHNPGWTIRALDAETLPAYVDLSDFSAAPERDFTVQTLSDLLRLSLMSTHGGVWADATCFCRRPLDEWLFGHLDSGFFSFERDGRPINWFMAAVPGNRAVHTWLREARAYWSDCPPGLYASLRTPRRIDRLVERAHELAKGRVRPAYAVDQALRVAGRWIRRHPEIYFSPLFRNILQHAPYYWFHILFGHCYAKHPDMRRIWDDTPKVRAAGLIELGGFEGLCAPLSGSTRRAIDEGLTPAYKLNWRLDLAEAGPGSFLDHLFSTIPTPVIDASHRR